MTDTFPEFCKTCIHRGEGTGGAHCLPCEVRYNVVTKEPRPSNYVVDYKVTESPIKDSGERTVFSTGFQRDMHTGKGRMDLLPWNAIIAVSKHCENGALKYGEHNVDLGCPIHSLMDSGMRHAAKVLIGMDDEPHLEAACWNFLWALEMKLTRPDMTDIPWKPEDKENK
jgi:hypothetical protein